MDEDGTERVIGGGRDLLGRQLDAPEVRSYLLSLGPVEESSEEEEQGPEHYTAVKSAGLECLSEEGVIQAVTLYAGHTGPLPHGLAMGMTRTEVRALLGKPQFEREATEVQYLGRYGPCDRYDQRDFSTAIDYDEATETIRMVQLLLPEAVPR